MTTVTVTTHAAAVATSPDAMSTGAKVFAFGTMCVGMFIVLLDIQIVSASLRDIGGALSAGADETVWVQTNYRIAEIIVIPLSGWLSRVDDINLVPGIFVTIAVPLLVKVGRPNWSLVRGADYLGIVLMALFLASLEYTLEEGPRWDWFDDEAILTTAWIAGVSGVAFIWRTLTYANPIVDLRALKERNFALGCFFSFVTGIGIFASIYLTPLYRGRVRGFSALDIGLALFSAGVFQMASIPFYAFLANRVDLRWLTMSGLGMFAVSMWFFASITHDWGAVQLLLPQALRGMVL